MPKENSLFKLFSIGKSFEGREIYGVKISTGGSKEKPVVLIDAGIHAREWIAPSTAMYTIRRFARNETKDIEILNNVDFYIIPVLNPDGYQFTRSSPYVSYFQN